jgi:GcrA cell cycle regulator
MIWTEARIESLAQMWAAGHSATLISRALGEGITRNAVVGKVQRLGLPTRTTTLPRIYAERGSSRAMWRAAAEARGISVDRLKRCILAAIYDEKIIAILLREDPS